MAYNTLEWMEQLENASLFWDDARERVLEIAEKNGISVEIEKHDSSFLYDLFDMGNYEPDDDEILESLLDYI